MDSEVGVGDTGTLRMGEQNLQDQRCIDLSKEDSVQVHDGIHDVVQDDGEVLLVQGLPDFQVSTEAVVVDDSRLHGGVSGTRPYQQYQPLVVQGYVTNTGEVLHVQQEAASAQGAVPGSPSMYQHGYQPQMMHPDLYRLIKMFPDFRAKTLQRIFVMCHCDLKRALDQALFARQFRQLESTASTAAYGPVQTPPSSFHPYRSAGSRTARSPYVQMDMGADMYAPRGRGAPHATRFAAPAQQPPILLYQQADPRLCKSSAMAASLGQPIDEADVVHLKLGDLATDVPVSLDESLEMLATADLGVNGGGVDGVVDLGSTTSLATSLGPVIDGVTLGPGGDANVKDKDEAKEMLADLHDVVIKDSTGPGVVMTSKANVTC